MIVRLLVPRRADGGHRDRLWEFCRRWWSERLPEATIVEGAHDDGPFNRGAAVNAAAAGEWDVAVVCDADVVADAGQVRTAIAQAVETGRATLPYTRYAGLNQRMTGQVLDGYDGSWETGMRLKMTTHVSSLVVVPRQLWDDVGGFDERFVGWGHDDVAFAQACRVLGGGVDRVDGTVWHLFHAPSPERDTKSSIYRASSRLARRYWDAVTPTAMRMLVDERADRDGIALVVLTHGRRGCIAETVPSAEANLKGPIVRRIISDDSGDVDYQAWLRVTFPDYELVTGKPGGFCGNVIRARDAVIATGCEKVFWQEDDFTYPEPIDLTVMADILDANPQLTQLALKRQAWFPAELKVGGFMEQTPGGYADRDGWLEHTLFFTTNPHLTTRRFLMSHDWPNRPHSERLFSQQVLRDGRTAGYLGAVDDEPLVHHFGERNGKGY